MTKTKTVYTCSFCGYQAPKWLGKCPDCDQWNTFYEELARSKPASSFSAITGEHDNHPQPINQVTVNSEDRITTGIGELDRVLGGGLVRGAVMLIGGDPGIGKSTIALQALIHLARRENKVLYVSGEESLRQTRMRAQRLGELPDNLFIFAETSLENILEEVKKLNPAILVIDSIQTMYTAELESAPGSVSQIRETSGKLILLAKATDMATFFIGHVTKEGAIAGPRVLEHMVDTVLYFEGDRGHSYRILRAVKNRFGSTNEIGVFEMGEAGLIEILSPSELFLSERPDHTSGSVVVPSIEGTRPILVEIQALVAPTSLALPRRTAIGVDSNRASLLVAVLEKKLGIPLYNQDIFVNIAGGVRLTEPGVDLGIILAIASSKLDQPVDPHTAVCGEVGLTGEVRAVSQVGIRLKEASRLGFSRCLVPKNSVKNIPATGTSALCGVETIQEAIEAIFNRKSSKRIIKSS
jgi:DNA repair protein RadA/Sms